MKALKPVIKLAAVGVLLLGIRATGLAADENPCQPSPNNECTMCHFEGTEWECDYVACDSGWCQCCGPVGPHSPDEVFCTGGGVGC